MSPLASASGFFEQKHRNQQKTTPLRFFKKPPFEEIPATVQLSQISARGLIRDAKIPSNRTVLNLSFFSRNYHEKAVRLRRPLSALFSIEPQSKPTPEFLDFTLHLHGPGKKTLNKKRAWNKHNKKRARSGQKRDAEKKITSRQKRLYPGYSNWKTWFTLMYRNSGKLILNC